MEIRAGVFYCWPWSTWTSKQTCISLVYRKSGNPSIQFRMVKRQSGLTSEISPPPSNRLWSFKDSMLLFRETNCLSEGLMCFTEQEHVFIKVDITACFFLYASLILSLKTRSPNTRLSTACESVFVRCVPHRHQADYKCFMQDCISVSDIWDFPEHKN